MFGRKEQRWCAQEIGISAARATYCRRLAWQEMITKERHVCRSCVDQECTSASVHGLHTPFITAPLPVVTLVPLPCSHISTSTLFFPVLFASFTSVILHTASSSSLYLLLPPSPPTSAYSPLSRSPLASLPPALLFSTFEASLVSASSNKLWI